jgi:glycosyltransferase involved in cell wall biosynthesis
MSAHTPPAASGARVVRIALTDEQTLEVLEFENGERASAPPVHTHIAEPLTPDRLRFLPTSEIELVISSHADATARLSLLRAAAIALHCSNIAHCKLENESEATQGELVTLASHVGLAFSPSDNRLVRLQGSPSAAPNAAPSAAPNAAPNAAPSATPLVSIVIAAYNPRYLAAALASVAQQTWQHWELVVCDDHRGDAVRTIVEAFAHRSPQPVRYFKNDTALGVRGNYERCFLEARGEYVKYLNDDDLLDAHCIERLTLALQRSPAAHLATSHRRRIDARGFPLRDQPATMPVFRNSVYIDGLSLVNALLLLGLNFIGEPSTTLIRRAAAAREGESLISFLDRPGRGLADTTMWLRLALRGDCVFLADRLSSFRIHDEQQTAATTVSQFALTTIPELRKEWLRFAFYERIPGNLLRTIDYDEPQPLDARPGSSWQLSPIPLFTAPHANVQQLLADWLAKRNPFFAQEHNT